MTDIAQSNSAGDRVDADAAWDAYWETGPDDDPTKYGFIQFEPMARDAFISGYTAAQAESAARIAALEGVLRTLMDAASRIVSPYHRGGKSAFREAYQAAHDALAGRTAPPEPDTATVLADVTARMQAGRGAAGEGSGGE